MEPEYASNVYKFSKIILISGIATLAVFFAFGNKIDCNCETVKPANELELKLENSEIEHTDTFLNYP